MAGYLGPVGQKLTNLEKAEDAAHSNGDKGIMLLAVRKDTAAALAGTDADYIPLITDNTGRLWVDVGAVLGVTSKGQATMANSLPVVLASDQDVQITHSYSHIQQSVYTYANVNASATSYAAGDLVGTKLTSGTYAASAAVLTSVTLTDLAGATPKLAIMLFNADPADTTFTDDAAFAVHANDRAKIAGVMEVAAADWLATSPKVATVNCYVPVISTVRYVAIIALDTYNTGATDDALSIRLHYEGATLLESIA